MTQSHLFDERKWATLRPLRPRQEAAIGAIRQAVKEGHKRIVLQGPCGFGKTLVAAHLIEGSVRKGKRPLFTCPAITLVNQTLESFEAEGMRDIGVIQAQHERTDWGAQIQIASVQTLIRRALPEVDFALIDEGHLQFESLNNLLDSPEWEDKIVICLTATPWAKGMGLRWTKLIIAATTAELEAEGYSCPVVIYVPPDEYKPDISKLKTVAGDYEEKAAAAVMSEQRLVGNVVETWKRLHGTDRTFFFGQNLSHAQLVQKEFVDNGISCGYIDANTSGDDRKKVFEKYRAGYYKVLASVGTLILGVDEDVRCLIDACLTKSQMRYVQIDGRLRRMAFGKDVGIKIDHAGNTLRLGRIEDICHNRLDMSRPGEKGEAFKEDAPPKKPRECGVCHAVIPLGQRKCLACGGIDCAIVHEEGELVMLGTKTNKDKKEHASMEDKQFWYGGFLTLAQERNRSEGWAAHRYKEKFGVWPNQLRKEPGPVFVELLGFDKHCRIKFAKSKAAEAKRAPLPSEGQDAIRA